MLFYVNITYLLPNQNIPFMKTNRIIICLLLFVATSADKCKPDTSGDVYRGEQYITLNQLADSLKNEFDQAMADGRVMKYAFVIRNEKTKVSRQGGKRNGSNTDFTIDDRYNLASVTKTITAVALLQLIEKKHLSIEDKIWNYLPANWNTSNIKGVSFRQVLMHNAGFSYIPGDETYDSVRRTIEIGVDPARVEDHHYENINYGICRILVAYLDGFNAAFEPDQGVGTSKHFIGYVQKNIFDPINISSVLFKPSGYSDEPMFYKFPPAISGPGYYDGGNWSLKPGSAGAFLSVSELSEFLYRLCLDETLLSNNMKSKMNLSTTLMGWDDANNFEGDKFLYKGGYLPDGDAKSAIYKFDNGLQISIMFNNPDNSPDYFHNAYSKAWAHSKTR